MSGGGSGGGGGAPANTTANNTETVINQVPDYEQSYMQNLLGQAATEAAQPYQQFPGQEVAGFTDDQNNAFSQIENLEGNGTGGIYNTQGTAANNLANAGATTAGTIAGAGDPYLTASASYNPAAAAQPYEQAAALTTTPQGISAYMSPYLNNEVTGLENAATQTWNQFTAPSINNSFVSAGQAGSGRNAQVIGQQANLADQSLEGQVAAAENAAYSTAGQQAASAASNLGSLANTAGSTAASEAANLQNIGTGLGNLAATQAGAQANAATNVANTAATTQNTGITGAAALQASGQTQQNLNQTSINQAMSDFENQVNYPEQQAGFLSNIIHGLPSNGTATTTTGQTPATNNQLGSVSPLSSLAGSLTSAGALSSISGAKEGGLIKGYAEGGQVTDSGSSDDDDATFSHLLTSLLGGGSNDNSIPPPPSAPQVDAQLAAQNSSGSGDVPQIPASALNQGSPLAALNDHPGDDHVSASVAGYMPKQSASSDDGSISSALSSSAAAMDPNKLRNYQLLMMAKGFLTPAHSNAEAFGNAIGNYAQTGFDVSKMQADQRAKMLSQALEQQKVKQEGAYQTGELQNSTLARQLEAQRLQQEKDYQNKSLGLEQEKVEQGKYVINKNPVTGEVNVFNSKTGEFVNPSGGGAGGTSFIDPSTGEMINGGQGNTSFGGDLKGVTPTVYHQMATEDSAQRKQALNNLPLARNVLNTLDELEPNFSKVDTGGIVSKGEQLGAKVFNPNGQYATSAANIEKGTNALATDLSKFQYVPGMRGSVLGLQTILASKPGMDQPQGTNLNMTSDIRARVNDYLLTEELAQKWREASPLKVTDSNTYAVDEALKSLYPLQSTDPKTGATTFNKENAQKIRAAMPDAIAHPQKYLAAASSAPINGGTSSTAAGSNSGAQLPKALAGVQGLHYSPSRQQYKDDAGNVYDANGNKVQ